MHVLVVAHGPRALTKKAVARIRRFGDVVSDITIVAANPGANPGRGMIPGAEVAEGVGSAAVRAVAAQLGTAPTLLIHDDVAITKAGVTALLAELPNADFVVPHSNEEGLATSIGALPAAVDAAPALDRAAA